MRLYFNSNENKYKLLIYIVLRGLSPFRGIVIGKKLSMEYCRKVLEKSKKKMLLILKLTT